MFEWVIKFFETSSSTEVTVDNNWKVDIIENKRYKSLDLRLDEVGNKIKFNVFPNLISHEFSQHGLIIIPVNAEMNIENATSVLLEAGVLKEYNVDRLNYSQSKTVTGMKNFRQERNADGCYIGNINNCTVRGISRNLNFCILYINTENINIDEELRNYYKKVFTEILPMYTKITLYLANEDNMYDKSKNALTTILRDKSIDLSDYNISFISKKLYLENLHLEECNDIDIQTIKDILENLSKKKYTKENLNKIESLINKLSCFDYVNTHNKNLLNVIIELSSLNWWGKIICLFKSILGKDNKLSFYKKIVDIIAHKAPEFTLNTKNGYKKVPDILKDMKLSKENSQNIPTATEIKELANIQNQMNNQIENDHVFALGLAARSPQQSNSNHTPGHNAQGRSNSFG